MEEKKNNNLIIMVLMGVIILILLVLCVLFATKKITWNGGSTSGANDDTNEQNNVNVLTNKEAEEIVKSLFTDKTVRRVMDNGHLPYCSNSDDKRYTESELGLDYTWNGYYKCAEFNSYNDLVNYLKTFFTDNYYVNNLENKKAITTKSNTASDGKVTYNYYEKDGSLYYTISGKGSNMEKDNVSNLSCSILSVTEKEITADVEASFTGVSGSSVKENVNIKLVKDGSNWKIDQYNVQ